METSPYGANLRDLAASVRVAGGSVRLIVYPRRGHVGDLLALAAPLRWLAPVLRDVTRFIGADKKNRKGAT